LVGQQKMSQSMLMPCQGCPEVTRALQVLKPNKSIKFDVI